MQIPSRPRRWSTGHLSHSLSSCCVVGESTVGCCLRMVRATVLKRWRYSEISLFRRDRQQIRPENKAGTISRTGCVSRLNQHSPVRPLDSRNGRNKAGPRLIMLALLPTCALGFGSPLLGTCPTVARRTTLRMQQMDPRINDACVDELCSTEENVMDARWLAGDLSGSDYAEHSRKYRRTVFMHDEWVRHRSSDRFFRNMKTMHT